MEAQTTIESNTSSTPYRIKVCGMTQIDQLHLLPEIKVQFAGLNFYPQSPNYILNHISGSEIKKEKLKVFKIGVFVNATYEFIMKQVDDFGLDMVQLNGDETPYFCERVSNYVSVIKAFRFIENDHMEWVIKDYYADCDMFMFDSSSTAYGNTQKHFNYRKLLGRNIGKPFLLTGNILPTDIDHLRRFTADKVAKDLFAVDINVGFEIAAGVKDMVAVRKFVEQLNGVG